MKKLAKGFSLVELMIVVAIIGILSAVAIPNFMKFQAKSRQTEAKTNLKGFHEATTAYFAEKNKFPSTSEKINKIFKVDGQNLYAYHFLGKKTVNSAADGQDKTCNSANGATMNSVNGTWLSTACGNVDNDSFIDSWSMNGAGCLANGKIAEGDSGSKCAKANDDADGNDVDLDA